MLRSLNAIYANNLDYTRRLTADLDDANVCAQPAPNMNHAAWVVGHLALTADRVTCGMLLGIEPALPDVWKNLFSGRSRPNPDRSLYPPLTDLVEALASRHAAVSETLANAQPSLIEKATPHEGFRKRFPTMGQALLHTMIGHEQMHLGQLSAWRRVQGLPAV